MTTPLLRNDNGSIALGLLVVITLSIVAGTLTALLALQAQTLKVAQQTTDADQAAYNAMVLATQSLASNTPYTNPTFTGLPTTTPTWAATEQANTQNRWWITTSSQPSVITVHAQGRAGVTNTPSLSGYALTMTYNFADNRWQTDSIVDEAVTQ